MHRNSWGVIWSHPNSWERCLIRTHWLYIRDLCIRYLRNRHTGEGEKWGKAYNKPRDLWLPSLPQVHQEELSVCLLVIQWQEKCSPPPKCWHPDNYSSSLARIWVSTWNFQVSVPLLFPVTRTGKYNQMNIMGLAHGLLDYISNIPATARTRTCLPGIPNWRISRRWALEINS